MCKYTVLEDDVGVSDQESGSLKEIEIILSVYMLKNLGNRSCVSQNIEKKALTIYREMWNFKHKFTIITSQNYTYLLGSNSHSGKHNLLLDTVYNGHQSCIEISGNFC